MTLEDLAQALNAELLGNGSAVITGIAGIETAGPSEVTFVANKKYTPLARTTRAAAIFVEPSFPEIVTPTLRVPDPYLAFAKSIELFYRKPAPTPGIHPTAVIAPTAVIGARASIGPYAVIGENVTLGDDAVIHAHVVLYPNVHAGHRLLAHAHAVVRENCRLGDDVILQNGVVIGADGFGFVSTPQGWYKIVQSGPAVLEDRVEVQANSCIDAASVGETRIRAGVKVDNLVQVGHGSNVGEDTLLCAQVGLAGSTTIGRKAILAGQVGVVGHLKIGNGVIVTAQSGVPGDVPDGQTVSGSPAFDNTRWLRSTSLFQRLPEVLDKLKASREK